ncbi:MAG: hypothetical protein Q9179_007187 [Wetmoreana sp. 5 TL-2023]
MSPVKLSDGTLIQPGETIVMPSGPIARDQTYYENPYDFDGDRFLRLAGNDRKHASQSPNEYAGVEPGNLSWGTGRFSCPGRWYASAMMKLLLATLILEYDFKFPNGQSQRPPNSVVDVNVLPNMKQKIMLSKRHTYIKHNGQCD